MRPGLGDGPGFFSLSFILYYGASLVLLCVLSGRGWMKEKKSRSKRVEGINIRGEEMNK